MRANRNSKHGRFERKTIAVCAVTAYVSAAVLLLPKLAFWAIGIPVLGWPLQDFVPIGLFELVVPLLVIGTAGIYARSVLLRGNHAARRGISNWLSGVVLTVWGSLTVVAVVAFVLDLTDVWFDFAYLERWYDPTSESIILRGMWPKEWWPMLWVWAGSLAGVGLVYWFSRRRLTHGSGTIIAWLGPTAASVIVVLASFAIHEHRLGTPASMYTGFCVSEILGLLVLSWSTGIGVFVIAARLTGMGRKNEGN